MLIPGWRPEGQQPWTHVAKGKATAWPEAFLGNLIPQARVFAFDYKAKLGSFWAAESTNLIDSLSEDLFWALKRPRAKTVSWAAGYQACTTDRSGYGKPDRKVIFVAHSIGGVLCENVSNSST